MEAYDDDMDMTVAAKVTVLAPPHTTTAGLHADGLVPVQKGRVMQRTQEHFICLIIWNSLTKPFKAYRNNVLWNSLN